MKQFWYFLILLLFCSINSYGSILITVPHGHCVPGAEKRACDKMAKKAAQLLAQKLNAKLFLSTHYRADTDLNREEARITQFRNEIRNQLQCCRKNRLNCLLLDIHSFPEGSLKKEQCEKGQNIQEIKNEPPLYIIHLFYDNGLVNIIHKNLQKIDSSIPVFLGSLDNDIMLEAMYYKVPSIIIEFKETLQNDEIEKITQAIADSVKQFIQGE